MTGLVKPKSSDNFLFLHGNMLWVLIRSASPGEALLMSTHNMFSRRYKKNILWTLLLSGAVFQCFLTCHGHR